MRCATADGLTVQDVVYGTHPSGHPYQLLGDPAAIPPIPPALLELWQAQLHRETTRFPQKTTFTGWMPAEQEAELREALTFLDADDRGAVGRGGRGAPPLRRSGAHLWTEWSSARRSSTSRSGARVA